MKAKQWLVYAMFTLILGACSKNDRYYEDEFFDVDTEDIVDDGHGHDHSDAEEGSITLYRVQGGEEISRIKDFEVDGQLLNYQQDYDKHFKMWEFVEKLIPAKERLRIGEFMVFYGAEDLAGYVEPIDENDLSSWRFGLAIELANKLDEVDLTDFFTYVTIHEFAHVLTLNESQVDVTVDQSSCSNYFPGEGCARSDSYINELYNIGWSDIYQGEESNVDLYSQYPDRFVSDYAATNPAEDIAEVFSIFVTKDNEPTGNSIADQKLKLMYDYPELIELRNNMRGNPVLRAMQPGSWKSNPYMQQYRIGKHSKTKSKSARAF